MIFYFLFRDVYKHCCKMAWEHTRQLHLQQLSHWPEIRESAPLNRRWLASGSGYPCKPYLLTPYLNPSNAKQEAYNKAHTGTRFIFQNTEEGLSPKCLFFSSSYDIVWFQKISIPPMKGVCPMIPPTQPCGGSMDIF